MYKNSDERRDFMGIGRPPLPWQSTQDRLVSDRSGENRAARRPLVLVVDDDRDQRTQLEDLLLDAGCDVCVAADGKQALDVLVHTRGPEPDVILLDLNMPNMSGWEFIAIVKSYVRLARIPIIVVSGHSTNPDAIRYGAVAGVIRKPYAVDQLLAAVAHHCGGDIQS